ncbi:MAG: hypothetical protein ACKVW3_12790 [Phycisphaerales bacterium]
MRRLLLRLAPVLHLTRITTAAAVVSNTWLVILWTHAHRGPEPQDYDTTQRPLWFLLAAGALTAIALYAFGTASNDVLDLRRDRTLQRDRPLASGALGVGVANAVVVATLLLAILGAAAFGVDAVIITIAVLAAITLFNVAARFVPGFGLMLLGLIYGGHMLIPNAHLRFLIPVWLAMTHALAVGAAVHVLARKVPKLSRRALVVAALSWVAWSVLIFWLQHHRNPTERAGVVATLWPAWVPMQSLPFVAILAALYALAAIRRVRRLGPGPRAAEKVGRYGSLWLSLYPIAWMAGTGHWDHASILAAVALASVIGMTILREAYALAEQPTGYRL